jgi:hypothetical protein
MVTGVTVGPLATVALMTAVPASCAVITLEGFPTEATVGSDELQVTPDVSARTEPSVYEPSAAKTT